MCYTPVTIHTHYNAPEYIKKHYGKTMEVPCGRCLECRQKMLGEWLFRLRAEYRENSGSFVTLTYDDDHLIYNVKDRLPTLHYEHLQLFWKRLRKRGLKFKYFVAGEYSPQRKRPHYHALIFGYTKNSKDFYTAVTSCWNYGLVHFGDITEASIAYTLKYTLKASLSHDINLTQIGKKRYEFDRVPEKALMSKGLGLSYVKNADMYDFIINQVENPEYKIPRYYKKKLYTPEDNYKRFKTMYKYFKENERPELERYNKKRFDYQIKLKALKDKNLC